MSVGLNLPEPMCRSSLSLLSKSTAKQYHLCPSAVQCFSEFASPLQVVRFRTTVRSCSHMSQERQYFTCCCVALCFIRLSTARCELHPMTRVCPPSGRQPSSALGAWLAFLLVAAGWYLAWRSTWIGLIQAFSSYTAPTQPSPKLSSTLLHLARTSERMLALRHWIIPLLLFFPKLVAIHLEKQIFDSFLSAFCTAWVHIVFTKSLLW